MGIDASEVVVASTGVIGQILPIEPIENKIDELAARLSTRETRKRQPRL
jgi:glutamate N-acetyltransferase/amino-acid N-acetyltransferase